MKQENEKMSTSTFYPFIDHVVVALVAAALYYEIWTNARYASPP